MSNLVNLNVLLLSQIAFRDLQSLSILDLLQELELRYHGVHSDEPLSQVAGLPNLRAVQQACIARPPLTHHGMKTKSHLLIRDFIVNAIDLDVKSPES